MKVLRRSNVHTYLLIKSMQRTHLDPIDQAVYWNTYRKIVETILSVNRSSEILEIKKFVVTGKDEGGFDSLLKFVHVPYVSNKCFISILCSQSNGRNHTVHKM